MELDTGSATYVVSWSTIKRLILQLAKHHLQSCNLTLRDYQGNLIPVIGTSKFRVQFKGFEGRLLLIIIDGTLPSLLGLHWFDSLGLQISGIHSVNQSNLNYLVRKFPAVFDGQLGHYTGTPVSFNLDPSVPPIRMKPRCVSIALKPKVDAELDKLIAQGVLEPVDHARWETPIVLPIKPDGSVRICTDYRCSINRALPSNAYPVPMVQHLLHTLAEAQIIITHWGAFKCCRLQFGVSIAPGLFQSLMERLLQGLSGVVPYFDDVLISASCHEELMSRLSNHKPLLGLLAGDRQAPQVMSLRMTRWSVFLAAYDYSLIHCLGKQIAHADALGRCPLPDALEDLAPVSSVLLVEDLGLPVMAADIARLSAKDQGQVLLIVVDVFSIWLEVVRMPSTTVDALIAALWRLFAIHGILDMLVSDNGPQLTSTKFEAFLASMGIRHALISPFHPASNGLAERMIHPSKEALAKMSPAGWQKHIDAFLLAHHTTPCPDTNMSPAELLMG
ncbi:PREDICTED: uncharacterized protein K02A2.6-like [Thamnophis sirtalis]|uniref:Uncharacterized protein K02A2.6-like n=1 Tax=Thamnophis sirtalis TaxID=35019 RepID=A0A6I9Z4A1_9SAUR|nr:PREDICTED: uncharacterized protein K02A2.6-like [Thamnophis sirtalis]